LRVMGQELRVRNNCGFTLLELTISIMLIGIVVLIVVGAMRLGMRSVESGERKIDAFERAQSSLNIIDSQIQSFVPLSYVSEDGTNKYYFKGERELMQFSTNYSIWGGQRGYVTATYSVRTEESGRQALYASENIVGMEGTRETRLFDSFERIYFEYFYKEPTQQEGQWVDQWTDETSTPKKVRLHFIEGPNDLSMIIPFRVRGSPSGLGGTGQTLEEEEDQ
jgi:prepilin-type N-terminal cleavage/methylation domain-containing protein